MKRRKRLFTLHFILLALILAILGGCKRTPPEPDTKPPEVVILNLKPDSAYAGILTLEFDARDDKGVTKVECYANGQLIGVDASEPWFIAWNTTQVANGEYALQAKAYDASNNLGYSNASVRVKIANKVDNSAAINQFVRALAFFPEPPPPNRVLLGTRGSAPWDSDSTQYECIEKEYDLNNNALEILAFSASLVNVAWPGALVQGRTVESGRPAIIVPEHRPALTLTIDLAAAPEPSILVEDPKYSTAHSAITKLLERNSVGRSNVRAHLDSTNAYSHSQALIEVEISPAWLGQAEFHYDEEITTRSILVKYTQAYYTIACDQPSTPAAFFDPQTDPAALNQYMSDGNPPMYISSVTYGRLLLFSMTSRSSHSEMRAALEAKFAGHASAEQEEILAASRFEVLVIGGGSEPAIAVITAQNIEAFIKKGFEWNPNDSPGLPISYAVNYLSNNQPGLIGMATRYTARSCQMKRQPITVVIDKIHVHGDCDEGPTGGQGEFYWEFKANGEMIYNVSSENPIGLGNNQILNVNTGKTISIPKRIRGPIEVIGRLFEEDSNGRKDVLPPFTHTYFYDLTKTTINEKAPCFKDHGCNVTVYYHVDFGN